MTSPASVFEVAITGGCVERTRPAFELTYSLVELNNVASCNKFRCSAHFSSNSWREHSTGPQSKDFMLSQQSSTVASPSVAPGFGVPREKSIGESSASCNPQSFVRAGFVATAVVGDDDDDDVVASWASWGLLTG